MGGEAQSRSLASALQNYFSGFSFRFVQPDERLPSGFEDRLWRAKLPANQAWLEQHDNFLRAISDSVSRSAWHELPDWVIRQFDVFNTLHEDRSRALGVLSPIFRLPRMSTMSVAMVINWLVERLPADVAYVNVGVWYGFSLLAGMLGNADRHIIGIDNFSEFDSPRNACLETFALYRSDNHQFFDLDYKKFFGRRSSGPIGLYHYDGSHSYKDQLESLCLAEPYFSDGCIIVVDDTNWGEPREAVHDFIKGRHKEYSMLVDARTASNAHPTFWNGLLIFQKRYNSR
jgi:hypothetical protein